MVRQCAWCLRLMNNAGERTSSLPVPKIYEASHGMCLVCGQHWLEEFLKDNEAQVVLLPISLEIEATYFYQDIPLF